METHDGWPEKFTLVDPIDRIKKIGQFLLGRSEASQDTTEIIDQEIYYQPALFEMVESDGN